MVGIPQSIYDKINQYSASIARKRSISEQDYEEVYQECYCKFLKIYTDLQCKDKQISWNLAYKHVHGEITKSRIKQSERKPDSIIQEPPSRDDELNILDYLVDDSHPQSHIVNRGVKLTWMKYVDGLPIKIIEQRSGLKKSRIWELITIGKTHIQGELI